MLSCSSFASYPGYSKKTFNQLYNSLKFGIDPVKKFGLTPAEAAVFDKVAEGYTDPAIAKLLQKSPLTIKAQVKACLRKIDPELSDSPDINSRVKAARIWYDTKNE